MATVRTEKVCFGGHEFTMRATVRKDGCFRIRLPDYAHVALGVEEVKCDTLDAVIREFKSLQRAYHKMLQSEKKVIRYTFRIQERRAGYHYATVDSERDDISFGIGKGIQLGVANLYEIAHGNSDGDVLRRSYHYKSQTGVEDKQPYPPGFEYGQFDALTSNRMGGVHTVDWTQDRETWFLALCRALESLIAKLKELDEDEHKLLEAVSKQLSFVP